MLPLFIKMSWPLVQINRFFESKVSRPPSWSPFSVNSCVTPIEIILFLYFLISYQYFLQPREKQELIEIHSLRLAKSRNIDK